MRISKIMWKPNATRHQKSIAYFLIEACSGGFVLALRKDGRHARDAYRAPVWVIV